MAEPTVSAPSPDWMARGDERLPWRWAVDRLEAERDYWLVTVRHDGFPQARPVWGQWCEAGLLLSIGNGGVQRTDGSPAMPVTVHTDDATEVVIIEGVLDRAADVVDAAVRRAAVERYNAKYEWDFDVDGDDLNFVVTPQVAFGWRSTPKVVQAGTKWTFTPARSER